MEKINDGGPAFPTPCDLYGEHSRSMSLRDWFATYALPTALHMAKTVTVGELDDLYGERKACPCEIETASLIAYRIADAMIKARESSNG